MNGQWTGRYSGSNSGLLVVDLDDMDTHYEGRACAYDDQQGMPGTFVQIRTPGKSSSFTLSLDLYPIDPRTGDPNTWDQIASLFAGVVFPKNAEVTFKFTGPTLKVEWKTDIGTFGEADLPKSQADQPSEYKPITDVTCWKRFKEYVAELDHRRFIFRGQRHSLRLRTSFHRTGRADLTQFLNQDIKTLHRHLSLRTSHIFNLNIPDENGAFFNLVQHHGYPTPLLDWTYSPFVGAFFAYRNLTNSDADNAKDTEMVRIFIFDQKQWRSTFPQIVKLTPIRPHFSVMEFIAIDNERLIPQQSISSVTNVDDIESYIRSVDNDTTRYLQVIDLPVRERPYVMRELSVMGITAGSLFPGLDGACEELKERFFRL